MRLGKLEKGTQSASRQSLGLVLCFQSQKRPLFYCRFCGLVMSRLRVFGFLVEGVFLFFAVLFVVCICFVYLLVQFCAS